MRSALEEEEVVAPDPRPDFRQDRELTISSTTLLAVFFGLVLICGLFFGLGYTLGRNAPSDAAQPLAAANSIVRPSLPAASLSKPSAASQPVETPSDPQIADASGAAGATTEPQDDSSQSSETASNPTPQAAKSATSLPAQPAIAAPQTSNIPPSTIPASDTPAATIMVQIAAISNPADADVLVGALQKRGYSVSARHTPDDPLIHVQVGPFANRADAIAMRQKLLNDGYNAILK